MTRSGPEPEPEPGSGTGVKVALPIVMGEDPEPAAGVGAGSATVEPPITIDGGRPPPLPLPEPGRERVVPEMTIGGPPGVRVWPPPTRPPAEEVRVIPEIVTTEGGEPPPLPGASGVLGGRAMVDEPMTTAVPLGARETGVPEIVTAGAPGVMVFVPMMRLEPWKDAVADPTIRGTTGGGVTCGLGDGLAGSPPGLPPPGLPPVPGSDGSCGSCGF